ncbi:glycoside hydrolase family 27 protein, partial [Phenylobacterium sp.]|uniref:glycoside hydrolase family 27 protein n=1 Tax=Phenylobacterium sp. TaxID=1871053 RepID=UPI002E317A9E
LKLGIYEDAGTATCAGFPGSYGHYAQDAKTFASWGADYLKLDWCNMPFGDFPGETHQQVAQTLYTQMSDALTATGRPIVFSMCNGWDSSVQPQTWAQPVANLWRTTSDISDSFGSMLSNFSQNVQYWRDARPVAWNDPDMLEVGNGGMTPVEYRTHMSLWALLAAPLLAGNDLTKMTPDTLAILTNREVVAIDQDPAGRQGDRVTAEGPLEVWAKPLSRGGKAVGLFNLSDQPSYVEVNYADLGIRTLVATRDVWAAKDLGKLRSYRVLVMGHGVVLLRLGAPSAG